MEIKVDETFIKRMEEHRLPDKSVGLIEGCSKNVVVFAQYMLGWKLYSWQVDFLTSIQKEMENPEGKRQFAAMTSRQLGKSSCIAIFLVWCAVFNKYPKGVYNNTTTLLVSATDVQARKLLNEMKKLLSLGDTFLRDKYVDENGTSIFGKSFFTELLSDKDPNNTTTISFKPHNPQVHGNVILAGSKYGSSIKSYPPTSSVLGETAGIIIVDECGKVDKITDEFIKEYLTPVGNSTNAIRIYISTPWVPSAFFYRIMDPDGMFDELPIVKKVFTIEAIKLEAPEYYKTIMEDIQMELKDGNKDYVQRAYYCRFVKGEQSYFDPEDVREVFSEGYSIHDRYNKPCDMGLDFGGQVKSKTVITISTLAENGQVQRLFHQTYDVGKDLNLVEDIAELRKRFNIQRIIYDSCPAAQVFIQQIEQLGWEIHPFVFRSEKVKAYGIFRAMLRKKKIKSYEDDGLKTEMYALEFTPGSRQSNIQHAPGYSDDLIDSFLMSTYFFLEEDERITFFEWK